MPFECAFVCCSKRLADYRDLQMHFVASHSYRDARRAYVVSPSSPACGEEFSGQRHLENVQRHFQRRSCAQSKQEEWGLERI